MKSLVLAVALVAATPAFGDAFIEGTVLSVQPRWQQFTETVEYQNCERGAARAPSTGVVRNDQGAWLRGLTGALIGGAIGNQFGSGTGNDIATAYGAIVGGAIAVGPIECDTVFIPESRRELVDYRITYSVGGQVFEALTYEPYNVGDTIIVRVAVQ